MHEGVSLKECLRVDIRCGLSDSRKAGSLFFLQFPNDSYQHFALVRLLLLIAQRCVKVAAMKWDNLADGVWTILTEHREKGNAERLRLPQLALDVIAKQPRLAGNPYVFAVAGGKGHFNSFSQRKDELDCKLRQLLPDMPPWVYMTYVGRLDRSCREPASDRKSRSVYLATRSKAWRGYTTGIATKKRERML